MGPFIQLVEHHIVNSRHLKKSFWRSDNLVEQIEHKFQSRKWQWAGIPPQPYEPEQASFLFVYLVFVSLVFVLFSSFLLFQLFFMQLFLEMLPQFSSKCMPIPTDTMRCWIMYGTFWNSIRSPKALVNGSWIILSQHGPCQKASTQKRYGLLLLLLFIFCFSRNFRCL